MARLTIQEYDDAAIGAMGWPIPVGNEPALVSQAFSYTGTSAQSAAFNASTKIIRVNTDGICNLKFGSSPTALVKGNAAGGCRLAADQTEYFGVAGGDKVAAIVDT